MDSRDTALTTLLQAWQRGDGAAFASVFDSAYAELKRMAAARLQQAGGNLSLAPCELLHEAVLRVVDTPIDFESRSHFFATMSLYMRAALVDHARARNSVKRGGDQVRVTLTQGAGEESMDSDLLALDEALKRLEALDARAAEVLHLTYFAGLERKAIAEVLKISLPTVDRELRFARAWLNDNMGYGI